MKIPILNGSFTDINCDFRSSYPVNLMPIFDRNALSDFYLRPAQGLVQQGIGPGIDRGGINWNGNYYRVMGTKLCLIDENGGINQLADIGGVGQVTLDYGFDRMAIASSGMLFYWNGTTLSKVTDVDLGYVIDMLWVDGYYMTTDGTYLVVTDLNDPMTVNPLKYGSSEADPDPIKGLLKTKNEVVALNRYTIEFFDNVGGSLFPFARIEGAQIQRGSIGTFSCAIFMDAIVFLGSGKKEPPAVWIGINGTSSKLSTNEIDGLLKTYTEAQLSTVVFETKVDETQNLLLIHLPDRCIVYDGAASLFAKEPVWFVLTSSLTGFSTYRARNLVWCYDSWLIADPTSPSYGHLSESTSDNYGEINRWEFATGIGYNEGNGCIVNEIELIALTGRIKLNTDPSISTCYSIDGLNWSQEKFIKAGKIGQTSKRLVWPKQGHFKNWRVQKFKGNSDCFMSFVRLEADLEKLNA